MTFTEEAPVKLVPVMSISLDEVHCAVVDGDTVMVATDGTNGSNAQLKTVKVVPHVVLLSGKQLSTEILVGKSSNSTTASRNGFAAHAVAAALIVPARVPFGNAVSGQAVKVTTRVSALSGFHCVVHHTATFTAPNCC